jgi:CRP/FNR family nitrogen fixation transcriptional regulator
MLVRNTFPVRTRPPTPPVAPDRSFDLSASMAFSRNQEVFGEGEPAEYLYKVKSGYIRTYHTRHDGRRQIAAFYLPGDVFGLEARDVHSVSADAITRSRVCTVKRTELADRAAGNAAMIGRLLDLTAAELQRTQRHILLLAESAEGRVIGFLLDLAQRQHNPVEIELPMTRQDIADYLGLTVETVSRTLTRLERATAIALPSSRRVILHDPLAH